MLYDCNLKIYRSLNIKSEFNIGIMILYIIKGKTKISINGIRKDYETDDVVLINDFERYSILSQERAVIAILYLSRAELDHMFHFDKKYFINTNGLDFSLLKTRMLKIISLYISRHHEQPRVIYDFIHELVTMLRTHTISDRNITDKSQSRDHKEIFKATNFMYENCKKKICLADVARNCTLTQRKLSNKMKVITGMKYLDLLKRIRLTHCTYDLIYTFKGLAQIAIDNGYPNESTLIDTFRNSYKITPGRFRKQMRYDEYLSFHNNGTKLLKDYKDIKDDVYQLANNNIDNDILDVDLEGKSDSIIIPPDLLIYITNIETLTNHFQQLKLLSMRRESGQYGLLFSHKLICDLYNNEFEKNKLIDQMFSFSLEHQFDISFEIKIKEETNISEFVMNFERLLIYLTDCTYFYGQRKFKFYIDASYQEFDILTKIVNQYLKETELILIVDPQNVYLTKRMSHKLIENKTLSYKVKNETDFNTGLTSILNINPSLNILYQPNIPNKIESLLSIFKLSIEYSQKFMIIIDDNWLDSMIPSQSSHLIIKEKQLNLESQYQLFELILTIKRLRGEIVYKNECFLVTHYFYEYQLIVFPSKEAFKIMHQTINMNHFNFGESEIRHNDINIKSNALKKIDAHGLERTHFQELGIITESKKLILQFYITPRVIRHIYIKKKFN
nr:helix-turn-helix transcriptional regulator [Mammaliicoccus sp. Marseille-Q6498]